MALGGRLVYLKISFFSSSAWGIAEKDISDLLTSGISFI